MTADCRDKYIKKPFMRKNAIGNMLVRKFSFAPTEAKIQLFKSYCYPIYGYALGPVSLTAIVNSDAYHQSLLLDKWESMLYV